MKFSLSWLKEHLNTDATLDVITTRLTAIGHELEGVENAGDALRPFVVARVLEATQHPNADRLKLLKVDAGPALNDGQPYQVVCGAPNARAGLVGVFAPPGTFLPGLNTTLKPAKIRDVESFGMMCAEDELGLGEDHDGVIELPADAPVGQSYSEYAGLDDPVIEVAITPNRQDCMGVRGIARDLAASGLGTLKPLTEVYYMDSLEPVAGSHRAPDVRTDDADGCPAFYAQAVSDLTNSASPAWMTHKLKAIGQKPISVLVDITNFLSLDLGRPLHVYDRAKLSGPLVARRAVAGEQVAVLNDKTYTLDETMTVIADDAAIHDIGGIMGGAHSGVSDTTTDVLIECAYFTPAHIARTGQKLALTSDARQRFERGVDPAFLDEGLAIATRLVLYYCGGTASKVTRAGTPPLVARTIVYDPGLCARLGGLDVAVDEQVRILGALGFAVTRHSGEGRNPADESVTPNRQEMDPGLRRGDAEKDDGTELMEVTIPTWRRDIDGAADLVEEVVRIVGLDHVPSVALPRARGVAKPTATHAQRLEGRMRRAAAAAGLNEAVNWSFISEKDAAAFGGGDWVLANPISEELKVMRPSLLPGLLAAARRNLDRGLVSVRLFEIGRRYFRAADGSSDERATLAILLTGEQSPRDWRGGRATGFDAYDVKGNVLGLLADAGLDTARLAVMGDAGAHFHPGRSATLRLGPQNIIAAFGALHPATVRSFGLKGDVMAAELFLDAIPARKVTTRMRNAYAPPALQAIARDFAFLVPDNLPAGDLVRVISGADKSCIANARLFDRFAGEGVPDGQVSLAVEVTLQPGEKSFTEADLTAISERIVAAANTLGATLRT